MQNLMIFLSILMVPIFLFAQEDSAERFEKIVNPMVEAINKADYQGIQKDFSNVMLDAFPLKKVKEFFQSLVNQQGKITKLEKPKVTPPNQAIFPAHFERGVIFDIKVVLDNSDKIVGLWFLPHQPSIRVPEKHQSKLSLPFASKWFVVWGGDTKELNQHHEVPNQKYAFDFVVKGADGRTHQGEGRKNEDYYAYGMDILAPGDGIVTDVIDGVRDNVPGSMNPYSALGNAVFIRHREHEVSVLAHLKPGSIRVKVGDTVNSGQVIGLCGNSGNSSEPHLHYHLQNTNIIQEGTGIKIFFDKVILKRDGKETVQNQYSPIKGDMIVAK